MFFNRMTQNDATIRRLESTLAKTRFEIGDDGRLSLAPTAERLEMSHLDEMTALVRRACDDDTIREVVIDLSGVTDVGSQWTVMFAALIHLARRVSAKCRVTGLRGRAAAAASLYRRNRELMGLLTPAA